MARIDGPDGPGGQDESPEPGQIRQSFELDDARHPQLERLDHRSLDLALGLYRDRVAVKLVLANVELPTDCGRVALADDADPPHVVVARDGGFVTCLGRGMRTGRLPIVSRADVDAAFEDSARIGRADARITMRGGVFELLKRVLTAGHRLAREDFEASALLAPLVRPVLVEALRDTIDFIFETQHSMSLRRLRGTDRLTTWTLRQYSIAVDTARHLILLSIPLGKANLAEGMDAVDVVTLGDFGTLTGELGGVADRHTRTLPSGSPQRRIRCFSD